VGHPQRYSDSIACSNGVEHEGDRRGSCRLIGGGGGCLFIAKAFSFSSLLEMKGRFQFVSIKSVAKAEQE
jgi:hypothetical protein